MEVAIIICSTDPAGMNMKESLITLFPFKETDETFNNHPIYEHKNLKIYTTEEKTIYAENIDKKINADFFVFCSTHRTKNQPLQITTHPPGNWDKAILGGKEKTLNKVSAAYQKELFIEQTNHGKDIGRDITLEATHHGPYIEKPCIFIEIGNDENGWKDKKAGDVNAKAIVNTFTKSPKNTKWL